MQGLPFHNPVGDKKACWMGSGGEWTVLVHAYGILNLHSVQCYSTMVITVLMLYSGKCLVSVPSLLLRSSIRWPMLGTGHTVRSRASQGANLLTLALLEQPHLLHQYWMSHRKQIHAPLEMIWSGIFVAIAFYGSLGYVCLYRLMIDLWVKIDDEGFLIHGTNFSLLVWAMKINNSSVYTHVHVYGKVMVQKK